MSLGAWHPDNIRFSTNHQSGKLNTKLSPEEGAGGTPVEERTLAFQGMLGQEPSVVQRRDIQGARSQLCKLRTRVLSTTARD